MPTKPSRHHQRGVALVYTAIVCIALIAVMGLALDTARVYLVANELQAAADASALAGAAWVKNDQTHARSSALSVAVANNAEGVAIALAHNPSNTSTGDVVLGYYDRTAGTFTVTTSSPNAVKVLAKRTSTKNGALPLIFGPIFKTSTSDVQRSAIAMAMGGPTIGVLVLNQTLPSALNFTGTGSHPKITVNVVDANGNPTGENGDVVVNSNDPNGLTWKGNPAMIVGDLYLGGNEAGASATLQPGANLHINQPATADPLAAQYTGRPPKPSNPAVQVGGVYQAGYYPANFNNKKGITLGPGLHWFSGGIGGNITATQGSLIYVDSGDIALGGNDVLKVRRITDPSAYPAISQYVSLGIAIWINTGNLTMSGNPNIDNDGVLYLTGTAANGGGNASIGGNPSSVGSMLVTDTLTIQGDAQITAKPIFDPNASHSVFLVQ